MTRQSNPPSAFFLSIAEQLLEGTPGEGEEKDIRQLARTLQERVSDWLTQREQDRADKLEDRRWEGYAER
jgi:hypothetical protein